MTTSERHEQAVLALPATDFERELRALVLRMANEGTSKEKIISLLENLLPAFRTTDDGREDGVLEVLDALTGWCHPDARLLPDPPGVADKH
jgi:hypothetical protein